MKRTIFSRLVLLLLAVVAWQTAMADEGGACLQVNQKDGSSVTFALNTLPTITHDEGNFIVSSGAETVFSVALDEVDGYEYLDVVLSGINNVENSNPSSATLQNGRALVSGLKAGSQVGVYTVGGQMVSSVAASSDGRAEVDLNSLKGGQVYILRTPSATYKIYK